MLTNEEVWELLKDGKPRESIIKKGASKRAVNEFGRRLNYYKENLEPLMRFMDTVEKHLINMSYRDFSLMCGRKIQPSKIDLKRLQQVCMKRKNEVDD